MLPFPSGQHITTEISSVNKRTDSLVKIHNLENHLREDVTRVFIGLHDIYEQQSIKWE